jgi:hypothetical protein
MVLQLGIEPRILAYKASVIPFNYSSLVAVAGLEPATFGL